MDKKNREISNFSLEELIELNSTLEKVPFWSLYHYMNSGRGALYPDVLKLLSPTQRQKIFDLENWNKQDFLIEKCEYWLEQIYLSQDIGLMKDFAKSEDFLTFLKGRFSISTFDLEFPEYPDHDFFFLTDDNQFLIEFDSEFKLAEELRQIIRTMYAELGVNKSHETLLKIISESFYSMQEELYQKKKERLREIGVTDYYEALIMLKKFKSLINLNKFISEQVYKKPNEVKQDEDFVFKEKYFRKEIKRNISHDILKMEVDILNDRTKKTYFDFYLTKLVNSVLNLKGKLKSTLLEIKKESLEVKNFLTLGLEYVRSIYSYEEIKVSLFEKFTLEEVYNIGMNLIDLRKKSLKKLVESYFKEEERYFLGDHINLFLEDFFLNSKVRFNGNLDDISSMDHLNFVDLKIGNISERIEAISESKKSFDENNLSFMNYERDEVDYECLVLTELIVDFLKLESNVLSGVTLEDFKRFTSEFSSDDLTDNYIKVIYNDHFSNLEKSFITKENIKHVSGVLIKD